MRPLIDCALAAFRARQFCFRSPQQLVFRLPLTKEWLLSPLGDWEIFRLRLRQELKTGLFCGLKSNWSSPLNRHAKDLQSRRSYFSKEPESCGD
jgi:hypothetical protein